MNIINWLDGKKTVIGAIALLIITYLSINELIDKSTQQLLIGIVTVWTGVAIGDKLRKASKKGK